MKKSTAKHTQSTKDHKMDNQPPNISDECEYPHWGRVYFIVIIYTAALIIGLWVFSEQFH